LSGGAGILLDVHTLKNPRNALLILYHPLRLVILLMCLTPVERAQSQLLIELASMGASEFSVDTASTTAIYTQNSSGINFEGYQMLGSTVGGFWLGSVPFNWSQYDLSSFALLMSVTAENPEIPFTLELYDESLRIAAILEGNTRGLSSALGLSLLSLVSVGSGSMARVSAAQLTWDAESQLDATWAKLATVPEPKTYSILVIYALMLSAKFAARWLSRLLRT
jgi:hypothetical protein